MVPEAKLFRFLDEELLNQRKEAILQGFLTPSVGESNEQFFFESR